MDKGVGMMMRNKVEELALLNTFLIPFQNIRNQRKSATKFDDTSNKEDLMTLQTRRLT